MKIDLEEPFKSVWNKGYLVINKEPRRNIVLFNNHKDRTTISYARYKMSVHLGRFLDKTEVVDHINNDKMDDRLDNYQILTVLENNVKSIKHRKAGRSKVKFQCACSKVFIKSRNCTHLVIKTKITDYCSRSCAGYDGGSMPPTPDTLLEPSGNLERLVKY